MILFVELLIACALWQEPDPLPGFGGRIVDFELCGDLDGDGLEDYLMRGNTRPPGIYAFSAREGAPVSVTPIPDANRLTALGDLDGDGLSEVAVGTNSRVLVVSGSSGQVLDTFDPQNVHTEPHVDDGASYIVARVPDVDGDGSDEMAISYVADTIAVERGMTAKPVHVVSPATGHTHYRLDCEARTEIVGLPDVNGDGAGELVLIVGDLRAYRRPHPDRVTVVSGKDGERLFDLSIGEAGLNRYGISAWQACEGEPGRILVARSSGRVFEFSGADGRLLRDLWGARSDRVRLKLDHGDAAVDCGPDLDGDGVDDFLVSMNACKGATGYAWLCSGADGSVIHSFGGGMFEDIGLFSSFLDDIDGDGVADLITGGESCGGVYFDVRPAHVYSGRTGKLLYTVPNPTLTGPAPK